MVSIRIIWAVAVVALVGSGAVRGADGPKDPLKEAGLTRSGNSLVLADEAPVLDGMKALRATKAQADKETRARTVIDNQIALKKKTIADDDKEWHSRESRLSLVTDAYAHNQVVLRMNRLLADMKDAEASIKDLEAQITKLSSAGKIKFVDDLASLSAKADAVVAKYQALAGDAEVKAAIGKTPTVALGPSPDFAVAVADMKKWQSAVESEAIQLQEREGAGTHAVEALLNGEHFFMEVDTGASEITLPADIAQKLNIVPGDQDPTIQMKMANGSIIEGKEMSIKSVRIGRFTVADVPCVVLQVNSADAPTILGNSFLNHFVVNLDPAKNELRLTEIKDPSQVKTLKATTSESK